MTSPGVDRPTCVTDHGWSRGCLQILGHPSWEGAVNHALPSEEKIWMGKEKESGGCEWRRRGVDVTVFWGRIRLMTRFCSGKLPGLRRRLRKILKMATLCSTSHLPAADKLRPVCYFVSGVGSVGFAVIWMTRDYGKMLHIEAKPTLLIGDWGKLENNAASHCNGWTFSDLTNTPFRVSRQGQKYKMLPLAHFTLLIAIKLSYMMRAFLKTLYQHDIDIYFTHLKNFSTIIHYQNSNFLPWIA